MSAAEEIVARSALASLRAHREAIATHTERLYANVALARRCGATWQEIADELGVTKQAAHARFCECR